MKGCFGCSFEYDYLRNIVYLARRTLVVELSTFPGRISETDLAGVELTTSTSITGDVTTNPPMAC